MSSLLQGLKFVRRSEGEEKRLSRKKKRADKREKTRRSSGHKEKSDHASTNSSEENDATAKATTALPRDDWMAMPFMRSDDNPIEIQKTLTELRAEAKQKKIQEEVNAGLREPVTGMVYGLYDPRKPEAVPTVSSQSVLKGDALTLMEEKKEMPLVGDGGASWRAKMLKCAETKARATGVALEEIVEGRFGSIALLKQRATGSAAANAHLQDKRQWTKDKSRSRLDRERKIKGKTPLAKFSSRVQRSAMNVENNRREQRNPQAKEPRNVDTLLPDCKDRGARSRASQREERKKQDRSSCDRRFQRQQHGRSRSRSRERSIDATRLRRLECHRSCSRSPHRLQSPESHDKPRQSQQRNSKSVNEVAPSVKLEETQPVCMRDHSISMVEKLELTKRKAFLYGKTKPAAREITTRGSVSPLQGQNHVPKVTSGSVVKADDKKNEMDGKTELNRLAAKALRAQMMGKTALFHQLTEQLNEREAKLEREKVAAALPHDEALAGALPPLEKEDMRYGSRKGKKKRAIVSDVDGEASLEELVREERMASTRTSQGNMDANHARNIFRLGLRYKGSEGNAQTCHSSGFDEEEQVDMAMLQEPGSKLTRRARAQREHAIAVNESQRWHERTQQCSLCLTSPVCKKHLMLSVGEVTYLAVPTRRRLHAGHCVIRPLEHVCSMVQADEHVSHEITQFQNALKRMCAQAFNMSIVFIEQTSAPHRKLHTWIECIPVDSKLALEMPLYFKQELVQADTEWGTHQAVIDTSHSGIKGHVPPTFPYFHIEWQTRKGRGGYAHVIEDESTFPRDFGISVVAGMLKVPLTQDRRRHGSLEDDKRDVLAFLETWKAFDWTQALEGGELVRP